MADTRTAVGELRTRINALAPEFEKVLPPHVTPERFARVVLTALNKNPELALANRNSFYASIMVCAQDGLLPDGREAAIVVFGKGENAMAQYLPMIGGILKKVRQSGELHTIDAQVVYEKDYFDHALGDDPYIHHKPFLDGDRGKPVRAYAIAKTKDGGIYRETMSASEIEAVRKVSRAGASGPWAGSFASEMWRKTVLRRLSKRLPMSTDVETVMHRDDDLFLPAEAEQQPTRPALQVEAGTPTTRKRPRALAAVAEQAPPVKEVELTQPEAEEPAEPAQGDAWFGPENAQAEGNSI